MRLRVVLKRWLRWLFTTTRGLLLLSLLCSAACAYRVYKVNHYQAAVRALEAQGVSLGDPYFDYFGPDAVWDYVFHDVLNRKFRIYVEMPDFLRLDTYTWVMMKTPGVSDEAAEHLRQLHGVNRLSIRSDSPDKEPVENLRQVRVTDYVTLQGPWVDEEVIRAATLIPGLPHRRTESGGIEVSGAD